MEPSIIHSLIDSVHTQLNLQKTAINSPNSQNKHINRSKTTVKVSNSTFNLTVPSDNYSNLPSVDKAGLHAVFLNTGQVYFGRLELIRAGGKFISLKTVYYLQDSTGVEDVSLVKLGNELHAPFDEMHINVDQITFWEKLKDEGAVAMAIAEYEKQNNNR